MPRQPSALALLIVLLAAGGVAWPMGQKMDIFAPVDILVAEKRYPEAIDMLRGLLVSAPSKTSAIKERIAKTQLKQAQEQIKNQEYNEALSTLMHFWAQNPERADQAQRLIREINKVHEEYNKQAKELLAYMSDAANRGSPAYNEEVAKRLQKLDDLDRNNPDSKKQITSLKETSLALINRDAMKKLMTAGRALVDSGDYSKALRKYLEGFPLFKAEFENAGYDELTMQAVASLVRRAQAMPDAFDALKAGLVKAVADLASAFDSGAQERIDAALPAASQALEEFRALREALFSTGESLAKSFETIPKEGKSPIEYQYLAYLDIFLRGRPDSFGPETKPDEEKAKPEGMGGALLAQTEILLDRLAQAAQARVDAAYAEAQKAFDGAAYAEAQAAFARAEALVAPAAKVLANWALVPERDFVPELAGLKAKIRMASAAAGRVSQLGNLALAGERLSALAAGTAAASAESSAYLARLGPAVPLAEARTALEGYRAAIRAVEAALEAEAAGAAARRDEARAAAAPLGDERPNLALAGYESRLAKAASEARAAEYSVATARFGVEGDYLERELAARTAAVEAAARMVETLPTEVPDRGSPSFADRSPGGAMRALDAEAPKLSLLSASVSAVLASMAKEGTDLAVSAPFAAARSRIEGLGEKAKELGYRRAAARAGVEGDYIEGALAARTAALEAAELLIEGRPSQRPERAVAGYSDPYPSSAILAFEAEAPKESSLAAWISRDLASMAGEEAGLAADPAFAAARARIEELARKTTALQARREASLARASEKKKAAATALVSARSNMDAAKARLAEAKALVAQDKGKGTKAAAIKRSFADARGSLDRGLAGAVESSTLDFDPRAWDDFQAQYASLNADLGQAKKDYVIGETFRLLQEGQTYYEQALFDLAAESLNGAQELWREGNDADQEQVKYWQNLVKQASDTNNKREVKQSDALYYEIGSYLSEARKLYLKGDGLMKAGKKAEAGAAFEEARQNIGYVTRAFPLNAEAGLLTLQILKSTDAKAYSTSLPRRIQEAVDLLASDASSGYSRIADLYKMEPGYPGLKAILERAEIKVGKRRAPPTKQELANAAALVASAQKLLNTGRGDDRAKAEASLNAALANDPANKAAIALLRDLTTLQGKTAGPSLGLADQAVLDQATRAYASQQYNLARDLVNKLLSEAGKRTRDVLKLNNDLITQGYP